MNESLTNAQLVDLGKDPTSVGSYAVIRSTEEARRSKVFAHCACESGKGESEASPANTPQGSGRKGEAASCASSGLKEGYRGQSGDRRRGRRRRALLVAVEGRKIMALSLGPMRYVAGLPRYGYSYTRDIHSARSIKYVRPR